MSKTTLTMGRELPAESSPASALGVRLSKVIEVLSAANQARAERLVRPYLARMPQDDLRAIGFTDAEIAKFKSDRHIPVVGWV